MNKKECYELGKNVGYDIAQCNRADYNLMDENEREKFISDMSAHESEVYRQYSPFEFFAHDINASEYPDELWDAYDTGVYNGILAAVKEEGIK